MYQSSALINYVTAGLHVVVVVFVVERLCVLLNRISH